MPAKGGLFAVVSPPAPEDEDDEAFSVDDDSMPVGDEEEESAEGMAGPFEAYAETVFDVKADPATRADALRQAIETVLEERGMGGGATPGPGLMAGLGGPRR
ncbi:MAG TPA: hypothetical protein VFM12_03625 [Gemmatimonadales bacterium]|nr:hypothetical protein [Gemmatimonadales bacterium]